MNSTLGSVVPLAMVSSQIGHKRQMSQFCGQEAWCNKFNSERAMMAAMRRVEDQYLVVGVTEMWEETLEVLEHLLPAFFRGALQMYRSRGRTKINSNNIKVSGGLVIISKLFFSLPCLTIFEALSSGTIAKR